MIRCAWRVQSLVSFSSIGYRIHRNCLSINLNLRLYITELRPSSFSSSSPLLLLAFYLETKFSASSPPHNIRYFSYQSLYAKTLTCGDLQRSFPQLRFRFFFHAKLPTSTRLSRSSSDFHTAPLCKFFLKVTAVERDIERPAWGNERRLNYRRRNGRKEEKTEGKNASVEKNYPIMPKARRNYERCYTWPVDPCSETQPFKCRGEAAKCQINRIFREENSRFVSSCEACPLPRAGFIPLVV